MLLGVPVRLSNPHFLLANQYYRETVKGMNPNPDIHMTSIAVEPVFQP